MEISRLVLTKATKEQIQKELSQLKKGQLRWERLKEAEEKGLLSLAKTRKDLAEIAGFSEEEMKAGRRWVSVLIGRGHIKEVLSKYAGRNSEHEYFLKSNPDYLRLHNRKKTNKKTNKKNDKCDVDNRTIDIKKENTVALPKEKNESKKYKLEFSNETTIVKLELDDIDDLVKIIKETLR